MRYFTLSQLHLVLLALSSTSLLAGTWKPLPPPEVADTEVCTNVAMRAWNADVRNLHMELTFVATPSNNVEVAFGTDSNEDNALSAEEARLVLGWECGQWKLQQIEEGAVLKEASSSGDTRTLSLEMRLTQEGAPESISITDGTEILFADQLETKPPLWLFDPEWNLIRLTARGVDSPQETFSVDLTVDGFIIFFR